MTEDRSRREKSSTSRRRPSGSSSPSGTGSSTSVSPGDVPASPSPPTLGAAALRDLAARHGIRPTKALGQNFLIDPNLARAVVADAGIGSGNRVLEIGAGLGSLTVALAGAGAHVRAIEFDRKLMPALEEVTAGMAGVTLRHADAAKLDWAAELQGAAADADAQAPWIMCSNLPYNIAVPLVLTMLEDAPAVERFVVMVQREVGERLAAGAGEETYGAVSVRVAYRAHASVVRRVPPTVFWPRPTVASVVVRIDRLPAPPVDVDPVLLWGVVDAGFAERRKTMRNALRRLGLTADEARALLASSAVAPNARAEELSLETFATIAEQMPA